MEMSNVARPMPSICSGRNHQKDDRQSQGKSSDPQSGIMWNRTTALQPAPPVISMTFAATSTQLISKTCRRLIDQEMAYLRGDVDRTVILVAGAGGLVLPDSTRRSLDLVIFALDLVIFAGDPQTR